MRTYESLNIWVNDPVIGAAARKILAIAESCGNPVAPWNARPQEFDIPFEYRYDADDEVQTQLLRRVAVLFAAIDIHCYWRDRRQAIAMLNEAAGKDQAAWMRFHEEALDVILLAIGSLDLSRIPVNNSSRS